jgi:hypothetical protein
MTTKTTNGQRNLIDIFRHHFGGNASGGNGPGLGAAVGMGILGLVVLAGAGFLMSSSSNAPADNSDSPALAWGMLAAVGLGLAWMASQNKPAHAAPVLAPR